MLKKDRTIIRIEGNTMFNGAVMHGIGRATARMDPPFDGGGEDGPIVYDSTLSPYFSADKYQYYLHYKARTVQHSRPTAHDRRLILSFKFEKCNDNDGLIYTLNEMMRTMYRMEQDHYRDPDEIIKDYHMHRAMQQKRYRSPDSALKDNSYYNSAYDLTISTFDIPDHIYDENATITELLTMRKVLYSSSANVIFDRVNLKDLRSLPRQAYMFEQSYTSAPSNLMDVFNISSRIREMVELTATGDPKDDLSI